MRKIGIFTTTRAEFGIFSALIREIDKHAELDYLLFVGGSHIAEEHGKTIQEISNLNFRITATFDFLLNDDKPVGLGKSCGIATYELANIFGNYCFDFCCILGDRFELISVVTNSILFKIPIIHLHGGEKSEGAIDEQIRHMITKAAHLHFTSCAEHSQNIRQIGESSWRIFNTGALGIDNIVNNNKIPQDELFRMMTLDPLKPTALMTYHPVTLEFTISPFEQIRDIFVALKKYDIQLVITAPNIDLDREQIISYIKQKISNNKNFHYFDSLGVIKYHSLIPHCHFVIGNSSSGIVEVPYFKIPTVNIGDRQKGRIRHRSVIDTGYTAKSITDGIEKALSLDFKRSLQNMALKFGDGNAAKKMIEIMKETKINQEFMRK